MPHPVTLDGMGEVQTTPTANTLLRRLKDLKTSVDALLTGVILAAGTNAIGSVKLNGVHWTSAVMTQTSANASGADADLTAAPTAGQKIVVDHLIATTGAAALILTLKEETSGTVVHRFNMVAGVPCVIPASLLGKIKLATADKKLVMRTSGAGQIDVLTFYHSEA